MGLCLFCGAAGTPPSAGNAPPWVEGYLLPCTLLQSLVVFYGLWGDTSCLHMALAALAMPPLAVAEDMVPLCWDQWCQLYTPEVGCPLLHLNGSASLKSR